VVRLFQVYYPVRSLVLLAGETVVACSSFLVATFIALGITSTASFESSPAYKLLAPVAVAILCSHLFDLYSVRGLLLHGEIYVRVFLAQSTMAFLLAGLEYVWPELLPDNWVLLIGAVIFSIAIVGWRYGFTRLMKHAYLRQRVYVLGGGSLASELIKTIREHHNLGFEIVGWAGAVDNGSLGKDELASSVLSLQRLGRIDQVIVALPDRREKMPVRELLALRLAGMKVEDAHSVLEKVTGRLQIEGLHPSNIIFSDGFRLNRPLLVVQRGFWVLVSLFILVACLPLIPFIALAIKCTSRGPVLLSQERVGRRGQRFRLYKFRTMRVDAEADTGPQWTSDNDPRITPLGRFLRLTRLDEIPQLWNVIKGDMGVVGPRPERPEFVQWLSAAIPYYELRHAVRPGITGWAQIRYKYAASLEDARQKLQYDLYYIKHMSLALDLLIMLETAKTILFARGR